MAKYIPSFESNDDNTYNLDLKDIDPKLAQIVSKRKELNRLIASAGKFFTSAMEYSEKNDKAMITANFNWAKEQIDMAKILILDNANQKQ